MELKNVKRGRVKEIADKFDGFEFVAGERYTFADIQMITTTDFFIGLNQLNLGDYPEIERHTRLMSSRQSFSA